LLSSYLSARLFYRPAHEIPSKGNHGVFVRFLPTAPGLPHGCKSPKNNDFQAFHFSIIIISFDISLTIIENVVL
jgi:hypothetical protein